MSAAPGGLARASVQRPARAYDDHIVQFYQDDGYLCDAVAQYLGAGIEAAHPVVVIATPAHREAFVRRLQLRGVDVDGAVGRGMLCLLDAHQTLSAILVDGMPSPERFDDVVARLVGEVADRRGPEARVCAFGEMVDLLCAGGESGAAIELEALWNRLAERRPLSLLCAYRIQSFPAHGDGAAFAAVCGAHARVLPTEQYLDIADPQERLREVTRLQQRQRALETELAERRRIEDDLRAAMRQRDEFLAMASHELRTPIASMQLQLQATIRQAARADATAGSPVLGKVERSVRRLSMLVEQLLEVAAMGSSGQLQLDPRDLDELDLGALVARVVDRFEDDLESAGCVARVARAAPVPVRGSRARLELMVAALLSNAVRYGRGQPVDVVIDRRADLARVAVRDGGEGIAAADQARIFERFGRGATGACHGGLGLGLWLARRIAEAHGGGVRVESEPGDGATFIVELPAGREA